MPPARGWRKRSKSIARPSGSLGRAIGSIQLEVNLALALLFSEKYADLEKLAARAEKSTAWRGFLVAAVAARQGVLDADRKATEISADADARREILQNAAEYLQQARLYAQAAALYEAAAQGSAKADELRAKAKAFAAMRRMGEAELAQDPPRARGAAVVCRGALRQQGPREDSRPVRQHGLCGRRGGCAGSALSGRSSGAGDDPREPGSAAADRRRRVAGGDYGRRRCGRGIPSPRERRAAQRFDLARGHRAGPGTAAAARGACGTLLTTGSN